MAVDADVILIDQIEPRIVTVRDQNVLLDKDLAAMYGTSKKALNQAVNRNLGRFPGDFLFQLTEEEWESLRSQIVTLKRGRGQHRKYLPYAFTEHGAIMAASVLNTPRAVEVSVFLVEFDPSDCGDVTAKDPGIGEDPRVPVGDRSQPVTSSSGSGTTTSGRCGS